MSRKGAVYLLTNGADRCIINHFKDLCAKIRRIQHDGAFLLGAVERPFELERSNDTKHDVKEDV